MSAVPDGATSGRSSVADVGSGGRAPCVVATSAGAWMTPIVGGVVSVGSRSSSDREKPYPTSSAAMATAIVTIISVIRDRFLGSGSIVSATCVTLAR